MFGISGSAASPPRLFVLGVFVMVAISMPSAAMSTATCPQCNDTHSCARPDLAYVECPVSTHQCVASFKGCHGSVRMLEAYCEPKAAQVLCSVASDQVCCSDPENTQCHARLMAFLKDNRSCDVVTEPPQRTLPLSSSTNLHKGSDGMPTEIVVVVSVLASLVFIGLLLLIGYVAVRKQRQAKGNGKIFVSPSRFPIDIVTSEAISDDSGCDMGESSGRGILQLEERTISREIDLLDQIGTGRFGEVYRGRWREDQVAVKIFKTIEEASFFREVELFNTCMLRHENILGFRAADNRDFNMETQLWMVLDYHCNGSLYDYLRRHSTQNPSPNRKCLGLDDLHKMALSIAAGVMHLHNHIDGQSFGNKPGIAHRDLKSKNILVKQDGTCCIADLGMAVRHNPSQNAIHFLDKDNLKVGTKRYMAPEILDGSINPHVFESFRMVDIYALALVLWEIATVCCPSSDELPTYKFPFEESVPGDPSVEDMYGAVCVRKLRPSLPDHWLENKKLAVLVRIIRTSWKEEPQSRFAVHRIWRNLQSDVAAATSTDNALISPV